MLGRDIIVIGASSGGISALSELLAGLPRDLNAGVFVVLHIGAYHGRLAQTLGRSSKLPVSEAVNGEEIKNGHVYVAAPDHHLILTAKQITLNHGPKENFTRPAIDPLFRSAALSFGNRVVGVVLTGGQSDGAAGLLNIKDHGGIAIVQDPAEAYASGMPRNALERVEVDHCCLLSEIPRILINYDPPKVDSGTPVSRLTELEHRLSTQETSLPDGKELDMLGQPAPFTCPDCGAVLYQVRDTRLLRFRCTTGHAMTAEALLEKLDELREQVSWSAIRLTSQEAALLHQIYDLDQGDNVAIMAEVERANRLEKRSEQLTSLIVSAE